MHLCISCPDHVISCADVYHDYSKDTKGHDSHEERTAAFTHTYAFFFYVIGSHISVSQWLQWTKD